MRRRKGKANREPKHRNLIPKAKKPGTVPYDMGLAYTRARTIMGSMDSGNNSKIAKNQLADLLRYLFLNKALSKATYFDLLKEYVANI